MVSIIVTSIVMIIFFGSGISLSLGKGAFLIAGFNTMPKEEKEKYDELALCRFMGNMMFLFVFAMVFWIVGDMLESNALFIIGVVIFLAVTVFMLISMNTNDRFKK